MCLGLLVRLCVRVRAPHACVRNKNNVKLLCSGVCACTSCAVSNKGMLTRSSAVLVASREELAVVATKPSRMRV